MTQAPDGIKAAPHDGVTGDDGIYVIENADALDSPFFLNSPHSGDDFPSAFLTRSQLGLGQLRRASDLFVDDLVAPAVHTGLPLMRALRPRSYIDLNREPLELDPRLIEGALPVDANTRSLRVAGGLGTLPRVIGDQIEIYAGKLTLAEALARIDEAYVPYHQRLRAELAARHARHGAVVLLDLHSMPSSGAWRGGSGPADIIIGDRFGASAHGMLVNRLEEALTRAGFRVERNQPYAGGYITEHYGRPRLGWHAVQIEINRALYMDEARLSLHAGFERVSRLLSAVLVEISRGGLFDSHTTALHFSQKAAE